MYTLSSKVNGSIVNGNFVGGALSLLNRVPRTLPQLAAGAAIVLIATSAMADDDITLVNYNVLHGLACEPENCRLPDRIDLLLEWIEAAGCPDIVALQEVSDYEVGLAVRPLILAELPTLCSGQYLGGEVYSGVGDLDEEMFLSRYPIIETNVQAFHSRIALITRNALHIRVRAEAGLVDLFTTHLASSTDAGSEPCDIPPPGDACPTECDAVGATTMRRCQTVQLVNFVEAHHETQAPAIVTGDMNAEPGSWEYLYFMDRGWVDSHLAAGNTECTPSTGDSCTTGRSEAELELSASNQDRRIDYAFLAPAGASFQCTYTLDGPGDTDGDGTGTRIFASSPNPFSGPCGASPLPICWASDHDGNELDVALANCGEPANVPALPPLGVPLLASLLVLAAGVLLRRSLSGER